MGDEQHFKGGFTIKHRMVNVNMVEIAILQSFVCHDVTCGR